MSKWSDTAKSYFEEALGIVGAGDGGAELAEDIRLHVETEISERNPSLVTREIVEGIVVRVLGYDPFAKEVAGRDERAKPRPRLSEIVDGRKNRHGWTRFYGWTFGVVLPLITLVFEIVTGACASALFDPIPSFSHILLVGLVPAVCAWVLFGLGREDSLGRWKVVALGGTVAISLYYTMPLAVFMPFAVIGTIFYGFGFLPLAPLLSLVSALGLISKLGKGNLEMPRHWKTAGVGVLYGALLVGLVESPRYLTTYGMAVADSEDAERSVEGIEFLRTFGSESVILDSCLPEFRNQSGVLWVGPRTAPKKAREIFYRVTGREYYVDADEEAESRSSDSVFGFRSRWDWYRGDQVVGRKIEGVSLKHSRIDGVVEADAAQAYLEWTMEFQNDSSRPQEARAVWQLPPGAAVTRVNLWVNGEVREAAFNAKSKVVAAYRNIVARSQDPLLVTTAGKDHVLAQCFPIPGNGGNMKIRLGLVVPLHLQELDRGRFVLPSLAAENFRVDEDLRVPVWLDSESLISSRGLRSPDAVDTIRTAVRFSELQGDPLVVHARRNPELREFWSTNPYSDGIIQGNVVESEVGFEGRKWLVVLDTSEGLTGSFAGIKRCLERYSSQIEKLIVVDEKAGFRQFESIGEFAGVAEGGKDNAPALEKAFQMLEVGSDASILWIHGSQPRALSSSEGLVRQLSRRGSAVPVYSLSCERGMNEVLSTLEKQLDVRSVQRFSDSPADDLNGFMAGYMPGRRQVAVEYERTLGMERGRGQKVSDHASRLWALAESKRLLYSRENRAYERSAALAAQHQLVTPASGAVVLEDQRQYEEAGLEPVKEGTTASIPDSGQSFAIFLLGMLSLITYRRWGT